MMQWFGVRARYWWLLLLIFVASLLFLQKTADYTLVRLEISNSHSAHLKVYWTTEQDTNWSEHRSRAVYINSSKQHFVLPLPVALADIEQLRIDPNAHADITTEIKAISLHHLYTRAVRFKSKRTFNQLTPNQHINELQRGRTLKFISSGNDPQLLIDLPELVAQPVPWLQIVQALLLSLLLFSTVAYFPWLLENLRWVPAGLLLAAGAVLAMATVSSYNTHPDEIVHLKNAGFYAQHYMAPEVCAEEAKYTYSTYGVSRLNNREIAYVVGGRVLQLVDFVPGPDYLKLRLFNVALLFIVVLLAFRHVSSRLLFLPLLLTPQAWYLFSYYNSDALSLFAVLLAAYQIFVPESALRRLLKGERPPGYMLWVLGLAVIVALQFWVKLNYIFYPLFLGMLGSSWWLLNRKMPAIQNATPIFFALVLGVSLFASWEISRHAVNDFQLGAKVAECQEALASPKFKPSTPLENTHYNVRLWDKGYSLEKIIVDKSWPERIFYTALGTYGYTEFLNSYPHFETVSLFIVLLFLYVVLSVSFRGDGLARMAVLATIATIVGVASAALWVNWTRDFQPQGRYLIIYLPVFGSLMTMYGTLLNRTVVSLLAAIPFLLAVYSFFAVGLVEIPKS